MLCSCSIQEKIRNLSGAVSGLAVLVWFLPVLFSFPNPEIIQAIAWCVGLVSLLFLAYFFDCSSQSDSEKTKNLKIEIKSLAIFVLGLTFFITLFYKPFKIPSGSMIPTLVVGDFLVVDKFRYGYSRYSFPFHPKLFSGRVGFNQPQRGDVVVFNVPHDEGKDYIKRLIGLPGDKIQLIKGVLYINNHPTPLRRIEDFYYTDSSGKTIAVSQYMELLPNGIEHRIIKILPFGHAEKDNFGPIIVPSKHYFCMGDNRDGSKDCRYESLGLVPEERFVGKALFTFFSTTANWYEPLEWFFGPRWERIFKMID
jgi:signal peptidase I